MQENLYQAILGGCQTKKEISITPFSCERKNLLKINASGLPGIFSEKCTAIEPQHAQIQKGEQVSSSCGLAGCPDEISAVTFFVRISSASVQESDESAKI